MNLGALRDKLKDAIINKDLKELGELLGTGSQSLSPADLQHFLRCEVLPNIPDHKVEWFWRSSMSAAQYAKLTRTVYNTVLELLRKKDYEPGVDFSSQCLTSGKRILLVTKKTKEFLLDSVPRERHSSLSLVIKIPKEVSHGHVKGPNSNIS